MTAVDGGGGGLITKVESVVDVVEDVLASVGSGGGGFEITFGSSAQDATPSVIATNGAAHEPLPRRSPMLRIVRGRTTCVIGAKNMRREISVDRAGAITVGTVTPPTRW